ncbi:putative aldouronate transport system permease protein [Brachybacterium muris]|uniref:ABC transporter permease n=1 Tax=Brachybacterium muris TaxID=219301 RepID=UPI0030B8F81D|nr:putative aldouronate transport system permease protein [Brachybacterium muris]
MSSASTTPAGDVTPSGAGPGSARDPGADVGRRSKRGSKGSGSGLERRKIPLSKRLRRDWPLLVMVLPAVALMIVFMYVPMFGNIIAWQHYSPYVSLFENPWAGWENFQRVFRTPAFWDAVVNTLMITGFQLVFFFPVPIALALLLNSVLTPWIRTTIQSIVYLPHFFSWVLVVTIFQQILGGAGLINRILRANGMEPIEIMTNPDTFLLLVTSQAVWKDAGWGMIIFLAALSTIDPSQYEAAAVDGAGKWRRMWSITLNIRLAGVR